MRLIKRRTTERFNPELKLPRLMSAKINTTTPRPLACLPRHATPRPARPAAAARARVARPCPFLDFSN
jgi:hypothetical protein